VSKDAIACRNSLTTQSPYPYSDLIETSRRRGRHDREYELLDTGIFNNNRYFDVFVEYANVMRQALTGILRSKQYFCLDADKWLEEHGADPMRPPTREVRSREWFHLIGEQVISMPDKWEYPWFAAWDLAPMGSARYRTMTPSTPMSLRRAARNIG
jgi:hypothetical protein